MDNGKILFNESKDDIARKWQFNLSPMPLQDPLSIYEEKVSNGYASISENKGTQRGYVDIVTLLLEHGASVTTDDKVSLTKMYRITFIG